MRKSLSIIASLAFAMTLGTGSVLAQDSSTATQPQIKLVNVDADNQHSGEAGCETISGPTDFAQGTEEVATSGSYVVSKFLLGNTLVWEMLGHGAYTTSNDTIPMTVTEFGVNCDQQEVINWITADIEAAKAEGTHEVHGLVNYLESKVFGLITNGGQYFGKAMEPGTDMRCHAVGDGLIKDAGAQTTNPADVYIRGQIHDDVNGTPEKEFFVAPGNQIRLTTNGIHLRYWNMANCPNDAAVMRDALASHNRRLDHGAPNVGVVDWQTDPEVSSWIELVPIQ